MNALNSSPRFLAIILTFTLVLAGVLFSIAGCAAAPVSNSGAAPAPTFAAEPPLPAASESASAFVPTSTMLLVPVTGGEETPAAPTQAPIPPAINEARRLTLEFPPKIRSGVEGDIIRLTLEVDDLGNVTPTAKFEGNTVTGETIQIPDLYATHNVTAEAQLDLAGFTVEPPGAIYEPLKRGQSVTFLWSVSPQDVGTYRGTAWLHLNFENRATGEKDRIAVSAQIFEIRAVDFFGMSFSVARAGGVVGSVVSGVVGFPFIEDILKFLFNKRKKKK